MLPWGLGACWALWAKPEAAELSSKVTRRPCRDGESTRKESSSLSAFLPSGKASLGPYISKQQSNLMGEQLWLESILRDAHTHHSCSLIQLKVNQARDRHPLESRHCQFGCSWRDLLISWDSTSLHGTPREKLIQLEKEYGSTWG